MQVRIALSWEDGKTSEGNQRNGFWSASQGKTSKSDLQCPWLNFYNLWHLRILIVNAINLKIPTLVPWQIWFYAAVNIFLGVTLSHQDKSELFICVEYSSMPGFLPPNIHGNVWQLLPGKVQHSDSLLCFPELPWGWGLHAQVTLHCLWKFKVPFGSPAFREAVGSFATDSLGEFTLSLRNHIGKFFVCLLICFLCFMNKTCLVLIVSHKTSMTLHL